MQKSVGKVTWRQMFNKFSPFNFFAEISAIYCETSLIRIQQRNTKILKITLLYKLHRPDQFFAVNLILGEIFENKTQKQKRQIVSDKIWSIKTKYSH